MEGSDYLVQTLLHQTLWEVVTVLLDYFVTQHIINEVVSVYKTIIFSFVHGIVTPSVNQSQISTVLS